jgi:hypothetical protein
VLAVVAFTLTDAAQAQQPRPREGARMEVRLPADEVAAQPVVALVRAAFEALQRRDEAAVLALYEPPPEALFGLSLARHHEVQRFAVWRHLMRGQLSGHQIQPILTMSQFRSGQWAPNDHFSVVVESESDSEIGLNQTTSKAVSTFQVRRLKDGQYRLIQMELKQ